MSWSVDYLLLLAGVIGAFGGDMQRYIRFGGEGVEQGGLCVLGRAEKRQEDLAGWCLLAFTLRRWTLGLLVLKQHVGFRFAIFPSNS